MELLKEIPYLLVFITAGFLYFKLLDRIAKELIYRSDRKWSINKFAIPSYQDNYSLKSSISIVGKTLKFHVSSLDGLTNSSSSIAYPSLSSALKNYQADFTEVRNRFIQENKDLIVNTESNRELIKGLQEQINSMSIRADGIENTLSTIKILTSEQTNGTRSSDQS